QRRSYQYLFLLKQARPCALRAPAPVVFPALFQICALLFSPFYPPFSAAALRQVLPLSAAAVSFLFCRLRKSLLLPHRLNREDRKSSFSEGQEPLRGTPFHSAFLHLLSQVLPEVPAQRPLPPLLWSCLFLYIRIS